MKYFNFFIILLNSFAFAQTFDIKGLVIDTLSKPMPWADVRLIKLNKENPKDTTQRMPVYGLLTSESGFFNFKAIPQGSYRLIVSYTGTSAFQKEITLNQNIDLGKVTLREQEITTELVEIIAQTNMMIQIGDTTQYNSSAFKTHSDASAEDLVSKMPGVQIEGGKVKAQGEEVKKVLVNGKPFFGDDPNTVLKNIPADMVDKVKVYNRLSDQAQMSGIDDGNSTMTMDIIMKEDFKNGVFGRVFGGYGVDDDQNSKYRAGLSLNYFKGKKKITILGQSNNINEQNFTGEDLAGVSASGGRGGRGGMGMGMGNNPASNFMVGQNNGINTTNAAGINFSTNNKKTEFTGSYFFNSTDNNTISSLERTYISTTENNLKYKENSTLSSLNVNHKLNVRLEHKFDSLKQLTFTTRSTLQNNEGSTYFNGENQNIEQSLSSITTTQGPKYNALNTSASLTYLQGLAKKGRNFSVSFSPSYNNQDGNTFLNSSQNYYLDSTANDIIKQKSDLIKSGLTLGGSATYTEPITEKSNIQIQFNTSNNFNKSDLNTLGFDYFQNDYLVKDSALSIKFNQTYFSQNGGVQYTHQVKDWTFTGGINGQIADLQSEAVFPFETQVQKRFIGILPSFQARLRIPKKRMIRIFIRTSNTVPTVEQLQTVINNNNPLQLSTGNVNLRQDYTGNFSFFMMRNNGEKNRNMHLMLSGSVKKDYIGTSTIIAYNDTIVEGVYLARSAQFKKPINLDGYYNLSLFGNYSFPITKIKCNMSITLNGSTSRFPSMINNQMSFTQSNNEGISFQLSSNISKKVDFTISSNSSYNQSINSLQESLNSNYFNQNSKLKLNIQPWKGLYFGGDLSNQIYSGLAANINRNFTLISANLGYRFLKNEQMDIKLGVYDMLRQNNSLTRNTTETYYEDVRNSIIQRYYMLTLTWKPKFFFKDGGGNVPENDQKKHFGH